MLILYMSNIKLTSETKNWEVSAVRIYNKNNDLTIDSSGNYNLFLKTNGSNRATFNNLGLILNTGSIITTQQNSNLILDASNSNISLRTNNVERVIIDTSVNFINPPNCSSVPTLSTNLVNKTYIDNTYTSNIISIIYPIGIIISTSTSTNPGTYISGTTWIAYGQGQTLVGKAAAGTFSVAGSTGGAESVTLSANNLPQHTHNNTLLDPGHQHILRYAGSLGGNRVVNGDYFGAGPGQTFFTPAGWQIINDTAGSSPAYAQSTTTGISITNGNNTTTNTAVNILQPYIVVYYWTRTA